MTFYVAVLNDNPQRRKTQEVGPLDRRGRREGLRNTGGVRIWDLCSTEGLVCTGQAVDGSAEEDKI